MCYHVSQTKRVSELEERYDVDLYDELSEEAFDIPAYHWNGFSHPNMLIIPQGGPTSLAVAKWGMVPSKTHPGEVDKYYKDAIRYGSGLNAKSEKLFDHFIYKYSVLSKRCIIPVTGFYEPHEHKKKKYPYYIHRKDNESFGLAGIYTLLEEGLATFTILTKEASPLFEKIHNVRKRQPVLLRRDFEKAWVGEDLSEDKIKEIISIPYEEDELDPYPVNRDLFSSRLNSDVENITDKVQYSELQSLY